MIDLPPNKVHIIYEDKDGTVNLITDNGLKWKAKQTDFKDYQKYKMAVLKNMLLKINIYGR